MRPTRVACRLVAALKQESSHDLLQAGWGVNSSKGSTSWIRSFGSVHRTAHEQQQITTVSGHRNATANEWPTLRDVVKQQHMRSNKVECNLESDSLFLIAVSANYFVALSRIIYRKQDINKRAYIYIYIYNIYIYGMHCLCHSPGRKGLGTCPGRLRLSFGAATCTLWPGAWAREAFPDGKVMM